MSISDATLPVDVFSTIRSILVAAAPYVTNSTTSATTAANILAIYNDELKTRPQIVIHPVSINESGWTFSSSEGAKLINVPIDCYYSTTLGVDQLHGQVAYAIKNAVISGMELVGVESDYSFSEENSNKYHLKALTFVFRRA